jgi:hypothetical protein
VKVMMTISRTLCCMVICALIVPLTTLAFATENESWVPFDGISRQGPPRLEITSASADEFDLEFTLPGLIRSSEDTRGGEYTRLTVEDGGVWGEIGSPELPAIRKLVSVPYGASPILQIVQLETHTYSFAELGITAPIVPVQAPIEKIPGAWENAPFNWNQQVYQKDGFQLSSQVELGQIGMIRGYRFAEVILYPADVNPVRQEVKVLVSARLKILLPGSDMEETRVMRARYESFPFKTLTDRLMLKSSLDAGILETNGLPDPPMLLIITSPTYASNTHLLDYMDWKWRTGFRPKLVTTDTTGTTAAAIKSYIQNAFNNWEIPPTFVLLIGDVSSIPAWTGSGADNPHTDLNYSLLSGSDYFPDIDLARWSVTSTTHMQRIVAKTLSYEQVLWRGNDTWEKWAVFMASADNWTVSEGTHNYVITNYLAPDGYRYDRLYCHTYGATPQDVRNSHNAGRSLSIYSGHGDYTYWADGPVFYQSDVNNLTNTVYPFVQSYACLTGDFTYGECFMETWLRDDHAAIGAMGSSVTSYWGQDDILEKRVMEGFCANVNSGEENQTWTAGMMNYGKLRFYVYYGSSSTTRRYFEMYNIMGAPSVDLWTAVPESITVTSAEELLVGQTTFDVTVSGFSDWVLICCYDENEEIYSTQYLFSSGTATMDLGSGASGPENLHIVVTGHDCIPYEGRVNIVSNASLALSTPNGGETWSSGSMETIAWSSTGLSGTVSLELNRDYPSGDWETLFSGVPIENATQPWLVTGPGSANARIRISSETSPSMTDISDGDFTLQWVAPEVIVTPSGNDAQLCWAAAGSPYYRIYSNTTPFGTFSTLEGSTVDTFFYDTNALSDGEMKFYRVEGSTEP